MQNQNLMDRITLQAFSAACCLGFAASASAFDNGPIFSPDSAPALTSFTAAGQSSTWLGSVNGFIALSNDPNGRDTSDQWTFTIGSGLVGSLSFAARSGSVEGVGDPFVYAGKYTISLSGPVTGSGNGLTPGTLSGLTAGNYTVSINNQASYPEIAGYSFTVSVANPVTAVPEPSTWALLGAGLLGLAAVQRRRAAEPA